MKPQEYNPKAKEAFAKSLIDIGTSIYKSFTLLFTIIPLLAIFKNTINNENSVTDFLTKISNTSFIVISLFLLATIVIAEKSRSIGLKLLHDMEEE